MGYKITLIPGDGIGPEIVREARKVLDVVGKKYGHEFDYTEILMGGCSIDAYGVPLTDKQLIRQKRQMLFYLVLSAAMSVIQSGMMWHRI